MTGPASDGHRQVAQRTWGGIGRVEFIRQGDGVVEGDQVAGPDDILVIHILDQVSRLGRGHGDVNRPRQGGGRVQAVGQGAAGRCRVRRASLERHALQQLFQLCRGEIGGEGQREAVCVARGCGDRVAIKDCVGKAGDKARLGREPDRIPELKPGDRKGPTVERAVGSIISRGKAVWQRDIAIDQVAHKARVKGDGQIVKAPDLGRRRGRADGDGNGSGLREGGCVEAEGQIPGREGAVVGRPEGERLDQSVQSSGVRRSLPIKVD